MKDVPGAIERRSERLRTTALGGTARRRKWGEIWRLASGLGQSDHGRVLAPEDYFSPFSERKGVHSGVGVAGGCSRREELSKDRNRGDPPRVLKSEGKTE